MADYRIKAQKTGPRTFVKDLQMISFRGASLFTESGSPLIAEKEVYYPPDFLPETSTAVVLDSDTFQSSGVSLGNAFSKGGGRAALPIEEQFSLESEVSRSLLGIDRSEQQQGLFGNVSSYGLDLKDWVTYRGYDDGGEANFWKTKNSPAGPHFPTREEDDPKNSAILLSTFPTPYSNPGNPPVARAVSSGELEGAIPNSWARYLQGLVALYIIEYMVNEFSDEKKILFGVDYIDKNYAKENGKFDPIFWDRIWTDIDQGRVGGVDNIPRIPLGEFRNFGAQNSNDEDYQTIDLTDESIFGAGKSTDPDLTEVSNYFGNFFAASTRYNFTNPNKGHFRLKTIQSPANWRELWQMDYDQLPQDLKDWEFRVLEQEPGPDSPEVKYKLPYYLITEVNGNSPEIPYESLIFGASWPARFDDDTIPQILKKLTEGNSIGTRPSGEAIQTLQSTRAYRYQPGRISGFTYGVRVSEEGAGPGTVIEFGVENYSDAYFFRLKDGTDFSIIRRSTVPLGSTDLFRESNYEEKEVYVSRLTGKAKFKELLSETEIMQEDMKVERGDSYLVFETSIDQSIMNGDPLNNEGETGYIYDPDTVTMYKIEFGWYGAIGARFYVYVPVGSGEARWVTLHTLVIENQIGQPCLEDPFFFFKYRVYNQSPATTKLPQFLEKYGASYYIDGGDEGTLEIGSGSAVNRKIKDAVDDDYLNGGQTFPISKWATVLGVKPKKFIVNNEGTEFFNKKEIFPVSISVSSNKNTELKFVNQFGCQEHAHTFQEGFRCVLPEKQRLRAKISVNRSTSSGLKGPAKRKKSASIRLVGLADGDTFQNVDVTSPTPWEQLNGGLLGSKIISNDLFNAYVNPLEDNQYIGEDTTLAVIGRPGQRKTVFDGSFKNYNDWSFGPLIKRFTENIDVKFSPFRRDTTLVSTIGVTQSEFFILFTSRRNNGQRFDSVSTIDGVSVDYEAICNQDEDGRCDGKNVADYQIGVVWPFGTSTPQTDAEYEYPKSHLHRSRVGNNFGILMPDDSLANNADLSGKDVGIGTNATGDKYVFDRQIPNSDEYRYYEGLPIDFEDDAVQDNVLITNSVGVVRANNGREVGEALERDLGIIDAQQPGVPGKDGGACRAIFVRSGEIIEEARFLESTDVQPKTYFLGKDSRWDPGLTPGNVISVVNPENLVGADFEIIGPQEQFILGEGTLNELLEYRLPVNPVDMVPMSFNNELIVEVKYRAVAMYQPSLLSDTATLLARKVTGQATDIKAFIKMREGAELGSVVIAKKTNNGFITQPFSPHGCTLSVSDEGVLDEHNGGVSIAEFPASKSIGIFSEPGALVPGEDYSYVDYSSDRANPVNRVKRCYSFLSRNTLSGTGFSSTGDYPLRFLKFKDSGAPVGAFYLKANEPQEISLAELFNINGESVTPSFWNNKALFMIARDISGTAGDPRPNQDGTISVTLNYKEQ